MKIKLDKSIKSIGKIFSLKKFTILSLVITLLFFSISILSKNFKLLISVIPKLNLVESFSLFLGLFIEAFTNGAIHATVLLGTISILLGMTISMMVFKIHSNKRINGNISHSGTVGAVLGIAVPVCAPCGIGLISLIGFGSILAYLPFGGTELGILSVVLLVYAILSLGSSIDDCPSCQIHFKKVAKK